MPSQEKLAPSGGGSVKEHDSVDDFTTVPPSYESIFGQFKDEKDNARTSFDYLRKVLIMFLGTIGCTISLMLLLALPMSMLVVGARYKDECPLEPFIPIYLIVGGSFGILKTITVILQRIIYNEDLLLAETKEGQTIERPIMWMLFDGILNLFLFTWFIAGNIWVYSKYKPPFTAPPHEPLNYCNKTLYLFAFWVITVTYIILSLICLCTCCLGLCASCTAYLVTSSSGPTEEEN